jgi:hypothetical protein
MHQAKSPIGLGHTLALFSLKLDAKKLNLKKKKN